MKQLLLFFLVLLPCLGLAQDKAVIITPSMFDQATDQTYLSSVNGWLFRTGSDTSWSGKNIDVTGWKKMSPSELSPRYADKNGRLEGWFRIKIKLAGQLGDQLFGIKYSAIGAADLYVNGKLMSSFGNTGLHGGTFREYHPLNNPSFLAGLKAGEEYTIAIHFVDHVAAFPPGMLKSEAEGLKPFIRITGPSYNKIFLLQVEKEDVYSTIWITVAAILTLLFWFLSIQNPFEKNLRLIAIGTTFLLLGMFCIEVPQYKPDLSFYNQILYNELGNLFIALTCVMAPVTFAAIFKRKIALAVKILLAVGIIFIIPADILWRSASDLYSLCFFGSIFVICIYYIITSWKGLRGAQWAIVIGLLLSLTFGVFYILLISIIGTTSNNIANLFISGYSLSFPILLMVYVAMRFSEILKEVQQNAAEVLRLSEEKRQEALNRQQVLEDEVERQTTEIRNALDTLRATQTQLIQSEKMASLGELTAGIAHEIQNPLNFVNNFSEVNQEMLEELKAESKKPKAERNEDLEVELIDDLIKNEKKINHHGKRADAIVKGMLGHSRASTGKKEPIDINALADEYLRLSYHGLRSKDKTLMQR